MSLPLLQIVNDWLPPAINRWVRNHLGGGGIRFEALFSTWGEAARLSSGYDSQEILDKVLAATLKVRNGEAAYERDSVLFDEVQYSWPVTAALMWAATRNKGRLSVLDFGGSLGSSYFKNRALLHDLAEVRWSVVEQPHFVEAGRKYIQDGRLRFFKSIEECLRCENPTVCLLSSVLQYLPAPYEPLKAVLGSNIQLLIIDRTPCSTFENDVITVQRVPPVIYKAAYPMWIFSEEKLSNYLSHAFSKSSSFLATEGQISFGPRPFAFKGFIFERCSA